MPEMKLPILTIVFYINLCQKNKNQYNSMTETSITYFDQLES